MASGLTKGGPSGGGQADGGGGLSDCKRDGGGGTERAVGDNRMARSVGGRGEESPANSLIGIREG